MKTDRSDICYEVPMAVSHVGKDELDMRPGGYTGQGSYRFHPSDTHPREVLNFISANGNGFGCSNAVILRLVEMEGTDKDINVTLPFTATAVEKCNLVEEHGSDMNLKGNVINLHIGHNSIETYKIYF